MSEQFLNVHESMTMVDTVLVGLDVPDFEFNDGWYETFATIGSATELPFFSVRNRNHGLMYNNQETRDQMSYGMRIYSLGVRFFGAQVATQVIPDEALTFGVEEIHSSIWEADLPRHASLILRTNQDERLKHNCAMAPSGMGPFGGGMGHGEPSAWNSATAECPSFMKGMTSQSMPGITNRWPFPVPLDIPKGATLSVVIRFSEYAKQLLQAMVGPLGVPFQYYNETTEEYEYKSHSSLFGIQVSLQVERLTQQRGAYSR